MDPARKAVVAQHIREIGVNRILYGTDGGDPTDPPPKTQVQALHSLPLTPAEMKTIEMNVAPYLRQPDQAGASRTGVALPTVRP
jgi:hypothetical protein